MKYLLEAIMVGTVLALAGLGFMLDRQESAALCNPYLVAFQAHSIEDLAAQINEAFPNGINVKAISTHGVENDAWNLEEHFALIQVCKN